MPSGSRSPSRRTRRTPNNTTPTDSYSTGFGQADVPGLLDTGVITGSGQTNWAGDAACVPDGTPIAQSTAQLAGATLGIPGIQLFDMGTVSTTGSTTLQSGSVVSTSNGNLASLSLVNGLVGVSVLSNPQLTATSDGTTGTVTANDYAVSVTFAGVTTTSTPAAPVRSTCRSPSWEASPSPSGWRAQQHVGRRHRLR